MMPKQLLTMLMATVGSLMLLSGCASSSSSSSVSSYSQERPALHQAALISDVDKMQQLLAGGANPNEADSGDFTAIHWAAASQMGRNREMIELLVRYGANPNNAMKQTQMVPLQFVTTVEGAQALIDAGARLDTRDIAQGTPLHNATKPEIAKVLLDNGADRNLKNISGQTPAEKLKATLPHFGSEPIYNTVKQQYRETIAVLEHYHPNGSYNTSYSTSPTTTMSSGTAPAMTQDSWQSQNAYTATSSSSGMASSGMASSSMASGAEERAKQLQEAQVCPMYDFDWFYTGQSCEDGYAHGSGTAVNPYTDTEFKGQIQYGEPLEGTLYKHGQHIYEGKFEKGVAHGSGICFYRGSPEECRYYKGERVDALHKQRLERGYQPDYASGQGQQLTPSTQTSPASAYQSDYQAPNSYTEPEDTTDTLTDKLQDEMIERGTRRLLDELF
ncbi:ankyrin repeat domain-containing protein [Litoribrevibacter euphylliae]|uniref:Ankyrin repeat domain-containing protein n=1 Tax=Litoribrevibacter euphylliae TaxID=1834034 RepID=A0ABV7HGM4_9GAMM